MIEKGLYESYRNNLILKNIEMAFLCMHWGYYENADKDMKRIVKDIKKRPQLLKCLPGRQRKIIKVYRFSSRLGFLNLMHYKKQGKL
ncbi:hypothetical protein NXV73_08635 [Bacteroides salyersiae]|nr:hypothetical protein [Bacteroides salyersiae]